MYKSYILDLTHQILRAKIRRIIQTTKQNIHFFHQELPRALGLCSLVALLAEEERTDGDKDNEEGDDERPVVGDTRGSGDSVATRNHLLASKAVVNHIAIILPYACINYCAWHLEVVIGAKGEKLNVRPETTFVGLKELCVGIRLECSFKLSVITSLVDKVFLDRKSVV